MSDIDNMSESENDESTKQDIDTHRRNSSEQLVREVFEPVRTRQLKRDRPLSGYNFSPPSTPNGNHTLLERARARATEEAECSQEDNQTDDAAFTPRCVMQRTFTEQQLLVQQSVTVSDADWTLYASYLSPTLLHKCKPPLHPNTCMKSAKPTCRFELPCWCIACAGIHTKPRIASCMVCAAEIPYSVCNKTAVTTPPSQLPSMCFACRCAFEE